MPGLGERLPFAAYRSPGRSLMKKQYLEGKTPHKREKAVCEVLRSALLKANGSTGPLITSVAAAAYVSVPTKVLILEVREKNIQGISVAQG